MGRARLITLTTDFGSRDWFVGTVKGVIHAIEPRAAIIDLTHEVAPGDIRAAAFTLAASFRFFPAGTVHVAVVDPGVGGARHALAVQTQKYFFVGPDNGVLSWALRREGIRAVHALEDSTFFLKPVSRTFHGRDIFAPVAARLCQGIPIKKLGPSLSDYVRLDWPEPRALSHGLRGEVVYIDRFGNAITNIAVANLPRERALEVFLTGKKVCPLAQTYGSVPAGQPVAVRGSSGFLELAINGGNAARKLRIHVGASVLVVRRRR